MELCFFLTQLALSQREHSPRIHSLGQASDSSSSLILFAMKLSFGSALFSNFKGCHHLTQPFLSLKTLFSKRYRMDPYSELRRICHHLRPTLGRST